MTISIRRILIVCLTILNLFILSACFADYGARLRFKEESYYIYENEDKTIRFEFTRIYDTNGKLYIKNNDELFIFQVKYNYIGASRQRVRIVLEWEIEDLNDEYPTVKASNSFLYSFDFKEVENKFLYFTGVDKDIAYLKYKESENDLKDHFLRNIDTTLYRVYNEIPNPLSWYQNSFESIANKIKFVNKNYYKFYVKNAIEGKIKEEPVVIYFTDENNKSNNEFTIKKNDETHELILSGTYKIDKYNIILINDGSFADFPDEIILKFRKLSQEEAYN